MMTFHTKTKGVGVLGSPKGIGKVITMIVVGNDYVYFHYNSYAWLVNEPMGMGI